MYMDECPTTSKKYYIYILKRYLTIILKIINYKTLKTGKDKPNVNIGVSGNKT